MAALVLATSTPGATGGLAAAASLAVSASEADPSRGALLIEAQPLARGRGPTLLASEAARELERRLAARLHAADGEAVAPPRAAARGRLCWLSLAQQGAEDAADPDAVVEALRQTMREAVPPALTVAYLPAAAWRAALDDPGLGAGGGLVRADLPRERSLAALAVGELRERRLAARIAGTSMGRVASRRALAGLDPGGPASARAMRWLRGLAPALAAQRGQALPAVLGAAALLVVVALLLAAIGGAVSGKAKLQKVADLAAVSAVRSMRDNVDRLLAPERLPSGALNPRHLSADAYLEIAEQAARQAAERNNVDPGRLVVTFPDTDSFAPLSARAEIIAEADVQSAVAFRVGNARESGSRRPLEIEVSAEAEAVAPTGFTGAATMATGGGYSGPLLYRQGKPMRPDVALAFDLMAAAAYGDGVSLLINSGFRSDAEQAALFAANPDPTWVAPPGTSLHRCATELDIGPPAAYGWLAANAPRFGFVGRYSWEPWHYGFEGGPAPCSQEGDAIGLGSGEDGRAAGSSAGVPGFVPAQFRAPLVAAASRWNVSAAVLAAQLMAESNFNPTAVSPVGAQGIAQFMPGTAAMYGLSNPFDPVAAIDAQAHLLSDLMGQFGSIPLALAAYNAGPGAVQACGCSSPYAETAAYVARILSLLDGAGELMVPPLEVRLVD
jgi:hypothetical protein